MLYWLDTEFIEDGRTIDPISIGIVAEDGREYYAQNLDCDLTRANSWVQEHVVGRLDKLDAIPPQSARNPFWTDASRYHHTPWRHRVDIAIEVRAFCDPEQYGRPQFWGYYADYDWVVLCQLFGDMTQLPKNWPMYCNDLKQRCVALGDPRLPQQGKDEHNALSDARWNKKAWLYLNGVERAQHDLRAVRRST